MKHRLFAWIARCPHGRTVAALAFAETTGNKPPLDELGEWIWDGLAVVPVSPECVPWGDVMECHECTEAKKATKE